MQGNKQDILSRHLRACRQIVAQSYSKQPKSHYAAIYGVLFEIFAYFSLLDTFRYSSSQDDIVANIEHLSLFHSLPQYDTFGYMMGSALDIYILIPFVSLFAHQVQSAKSYSEKKEWDSIYRRLEAKISSWRCPKVASSTEAFSATGTIYQNTLLLFLHAAYIREKGDSSTLAAKTDPLVKSSMLLYETIKNSPAAATVFWPMVIVGTFLKDRCRQEIMLNNLHINGFRMPITYRAAQTLQWIWSRVDNITVGPTCLEQFIRVNGTGLCIG